MIAIMEPELHNQPPAPKPIDESLSGLIERVTFFNEENGFAVLKVKAKGHRDQVIHDVAGLTRYAIAEGIIESNDRATIG